MQLPDRIPAIKWISILWVIFMLFWSMLEGGLGATVFAALFTTLVLAGHLYNRFLPGRLLSTNLWLVLATAMGAAAGISCGLLTLFLMVIKTGLHGHGPEFGTADVNWVLQQMPLWILVGLLGGLGLGLLLKAVKQ